MNSPANTQNLHIPEPADLRGPKQSRGNKFAIDWTKVFGYDLFIAHSRADAADFAAKLAEDLRDADYTCFLDRTEAPPGVYLEPHIRSALRRTKVLILIVTPGAIESPWVTLEIEEFLSRKTRPIIPIDVDNKFLDVARDDNPWGDLRRLNPHHVGVTLDDFSSGKPTDRLVEEIGRLFDYTRANTLRRIVTATVGLVLAGSTSLAVWKAVQENRQRLVAEDAARNEKDARSAAQRAAAEAIEQRAVAEGERQKAIEAADRLLTANKQIIDAQQKQRQALADNLLAYPGPPPSMRKSGWRAAEDLMLRSRTMPLRPGLSIGSKGNNAPTGTLCCTVEDAAGKRYLLSMASVMGSSGTTIVQPGRIDVGPDGQAVVGIVRKRGPDPVKSGALAERSEGVTWDATLPHLRRPLFLARTLTGGLGPGPPMMPVHILGRGSGLVLGNVSSFSDELIEIYTPGGSVFSEPGDAGALVLNASHELIGLVWGGAGNNAFATPISRVLGELGVKLVN